MTDLYDDALGYGHLGEPEYSPQSRTWIWPRSLEHPRAVAVGLAHVVVSGPEIASYETTAAVRRRKDRDPDLAAVAGLLPTLNRVSQDVAVALDQHDPMSGDLLAFGHVYDRQKKRSLQVAAFPLDVGRGKLCVMSMHPQRQGWDDDRHCYIVVPVLAGERGTWQSPSPILQISFCQAPAREHGVLAVRTHRATFLLRVRLKTRMPDSTRPDAGRLKISIMCVIPSGFVAKPTHGHVSINPWFAGHFATVDITGRWQVWEAVTRSVSHMTENAKCIAEGLLRSTEPELLSVNLRAQYDGWCRVFWVRDMDTILLCNRSTIYLADVPSSAAIGTPLEPRRAPIWILDAHRHPDQLDRVFILTSAFIYHISVGVVERSKERSNLGTRFSGLRILQKIRHFRDQDDHTLRMVMCGERASCSLYLLSSLNSMVTHYIFRTPSMDNSFNDFVSDAIIVERAAHLGGPGVICSLLRPAVWDDLRSEEPIGLAGKLRRRGVQFSIVTSILKDMSITQQLVAAGGPGDRETILPHPTWRSKTKITAFGIARSSFVVDDDDEEETTLHRHGRMLSLPQPDQAYQKPKGQATVNYERVYNYLIEPRDFQVSDAVTVFKRARDALQGDTTSPNHSRLLKYFANDDVNVSDLDEAAEAFAELVAQPTTDVEGGMRLSPIFPVNFLPTSRPLPASADLKQVYQHITSLWLSPLSNQVPGRVRLAREQLARRIATSLCLASYKIHAAPPPPDQSQTPLPPSPQESTFPSQVPSSQPEQPHPVVPPDCSTPAALQRLAPHTALSAPRNKLVTSATTATARVLAHWDTSSPAEQYDWLATRARLAAQSRSEEATAHLSARERQRLQRRRARMEHLRRREEERLQSQRSQGAAAPVVALSQLSQPQLSQSQSRIGYYAPLSQVHSSQEYRGVGTAPPPPTAYSSQQHRVRIKPDPGFGSLPVRARPFASSPVPASAFPDHAGGSSQVLHSVGSSQIQTQSQSQAQRRGEMGPPRKKKRRGMTEGF